MNSMIRGPSRPNKQTGPSLTDSPVGSVIQASQTGRQGLLGLTDRQTGPLRQAGYVEV